MKGVTAAFVVLSACAAVALAQVRPGAGPGLRAPLGAEVFRDVEYAKPDGRPLLLDVYVPKGAAGALPAVVWIHGGAWRSGSKSPCPAMWLTQRGYVVVSISYRLSGIATFPAQMHDCKAAIRFLRANAARYNIDPRRIGAWGASAGGHLVAMLGTSGGVNDLEGDLGNADQSSRVQAVCDFFGPTDFLRMNDFKGDIDHDAPGSPESLLIGGMIQKLREKVAAANPITYVSGDEPPFLICHGDADPLVPINQSELLEAALKKAGVEVELYRVRGGGHGNWKDPEVPRKVLAFFDRHLKGAAPTTQPAAAE